MAIRTEWIKVKAAGMADGNAASDNMVSDVRKGIVRGT
jgi:hypothetical protein